MRASGGVEELGVGQLVKFAALACLDGAVLEIVWQVHCLVEGCLASVWEK